MSRAEYFRLAVGLLVFAISVFNSLVLADFQQPAADNLHIREHSLVKPYQGSSMVSVIIKNLNALPQISR